MTSAALPMSFEAPDSRKRAEFALAIAVVLMIALIVVPLPAVLLDLCLAASIGVSLVVLLV
jgi:flagellar biosynthesis protein FlhA